MSRFESLLLANHGSRVIPSFLLHGHGSGPTQPFITTQRSCLRACNRFLDFYQGSADEMSRGYFVDISEFKQHGGKIATTNKILIPSVAAVKFPEIQVE